MDSHGSTDRSSSFSLNGQPDRNQAVWHSQRHALPGLQWTSGGNQRTGSSFKGPVPGIPEQGEIQTGNLVPLWRAAYGTQPTRISEEPYAYSKIISGEVNREISTELYERVRKTPENPKELFVTF